MSYLLTGGGSSADYKLGLTIVRPNLLSTPGTLGNWTDGRISCRVSTLGADIFSCCDRCYRSVVCSSVFPSVCPSITLVHTAKAVGRNKMPFGRDFRVVLSNIVLDRAQPPTGRGDLGVGTAVPTSQQCCLSPIYFDPC